MTQQPLPPELPGVEHRYITAPDGVRIHVADAGPADGRAIMLVHGFPQHWWEWHRLIGPLADAGLKSVIASEAKQSSFLLRLDCFVAIARRRRA